MKQCGAIKFCSVLLRWQVKSEVPRVGFYCRMAQKLFRLRDQPLANCESVSLIERGESGFGMRQTRFDSRRRPRVSARVFYGIASGPK